MTDADTLLIAYFRQEFQVSPQQAKLLLALWRRHHPLSLDEMAVAIDGSLESLKTQVCLLRAKVQTHVCVLRAALGHEWIRTHREETERGRPGCYALTPYGRAELSRMLREAISDLSAELGPLKAAA